MQQKIFNPNTSNKVPFYGLIQHWILHIACISLGSKLKMFVLLKFGDYTKLNLVGGEQNCMERDTPYTPTCIFVPALRETVFGLFFLSQSCFKNGSRIFFWNNNWLYSKMYYLGTFSRLCKMMFATETYSKSSSVPKK